MIFVIPNILPKQIFLDTNHILFIKKDQQFFDCRSVDLFWRVDVNDSPIQVKSQQAAQTKKNPFETRHGGTGYD